MLGRPVSIASDDLDFGALRHHLVSPTSIDARIAWMVLIAR